jgi:hypothetical protein
VKLDPHDVAKLIGVPVEQWPGRCHEIAGLCLAAGVTEGTLRYGLWRGPVSKQSPFAGRGITHHGWVEVEPDDFDPLLTDVAECRGCGHLKDEHARGFINECQRCDCPDFDPPPHGPRIFDPTRWVFENVKPYLYDDRDTRGYYDMAGDGLRAAVQRPYPGDDEQAPHFQSRVQKLHRLALPREAAHYLAMLISMRGGPLQPKHDKKGRFVMTIMQVAWVANLPLALLGPHARTVYEALDALGHSALVPVDCREVAMGDGFYGNRKRVEARVKKARK